MTDSPETHTITIDGEEWVIDTETTIQDLRWEAAPSEQHVLVAWHGNDFRILDPELNVNDHEDDTILETIDTPDEFTFEPTNGRHHVLSFPEQSRLAGTTIIFPDPFEMAKQDQDRSDAIPED